MDSSSTYELGLTRLRYLIGNWEGTGKGPEWRFRAAARCSWGLNDHFLIGQIEFSDVDTGRQQLAQHVYIYYNRDLSRLVCDIYGSEGNIVRALGHTDMQGRLVLSSDQVVYLPAGKKAHRFLCTIWMMAASQWGLSVEQDLGKGLVPYLEGQMRKV